MTSPHAEKSGCKWKSDVRHYLYICLLWNNHLPAGFSYNSTAIFPARRNALCVNVYFCEHTENSSEAFGRYLTSADNEQMAKKSQPASEASVQLVPEFMPKQLTLVTFALRELGMCLSIFLSQSQKLLMERILLALSLTRNWSNPY